MGNWFGNLDLAYKYTVVFLSLLVLTFVAGLVKVFFDRRKMRKLIAEKDEESSPNEEQTELNRREKDEGDLFGIRAIEAGYFAGIPQSRPTSRASSIAGGPMMSSSTLVGSFNSPKLHSPSMASSVTSLPLAHVQDRNRDSDTLPTPPRRTSPPTSRLLPSEAELTGRHNFNAAVNMSLDVPPSPVAAQHPQSQQLSGSDDGESVRDTYKSEHYAPMPPQLPIKNNLKVTVESADAHRSHAGSVNTLSPQHSPNPSAPPSPRHRPRSYVPSMPGRANGGDRSSVFLAHQEQESSLNMAQSNHPQENAVPEPLSAPVMLLPQTYRPVHQRDTSDSSSIYSEKRSSRVEPRHERDSLVLPLSQKPSQPAASNATLAPLPTHDAANDPRFSEFYDAYFRNSQLNFGLKLDGSGPSRPDQQPTIMEIPSQPSSQDTKLGMAV